MSFIKEWPATTEISWWNEGRTRLNVVIRLFNEWQREAFVSGTHDAHMGRVILAHIAEGRQTWAHVDGGEGWRELLEQMESHVKEVSQ